MKKDKSYNSMKDANTILTMKQMNEDNKERGKHISNR